MCYQDLVANKIRRVFAKTSKEAIFAFYETDERSILSITKISKKEYEKMIVRECFKFPPCVNITEKRI